MSSRFSSTDGKGQEWLKVIKSFRTSSGEENSLDLIYLDLGDKTTMSSIFGVGFATTKKCYKYEFIPYSGFC